MPSLLTTERVTISCSASAAILGIVFHGVEVDTLRDRRIVGAPTDFDYMPY